MANFHEDFGDEPSPEERSEGDIFTTEGRELWQAAAQLDEPLMYVLDLTGVSYLDILCGTD